MKFMPICLISVLAVSTLTGCGLKTLFDVSARDTTQNQLCNRLKREIVFQRFDQNHDTSWSSPAKQAEVLREYQNNNCEAIINGTAEAKQEQTESTPFSMPNTRKTQKVTIIEQE